MKIRDVHLSPGILTALNAHVVLLLALFWYTCEMRGPDPVGPAVGVRDFLLAVFLVVIPFTSYVAGYRSVRIWSSRWAKVEFAASAATLVGWFILMVAMTHATT
jgi:hypothetical protein